MGTIIDFSSHPLVRNRRPLARLRRVLPAAQFAELRDLIVACERTSRRAGAAIARGKALLARLHSTSPEDAA